MTSKTLSTSTLSLKFMQNAHRAKQLKEVELDRAEVKDDGKWEVSQAVRESWGLSGSTQSHSGDVHEASYLPFLFTESGTDAGEPGEVVTIAKLSGRRVFNKKGEEVSLQTPPSIPDGSQASTSSEPTTGRKVHPRPVTIAGSGTAQQLQEFEQLKNPKYPKNLKTAREAIFDSSGVGTDLRPQARSTDKIPASSTFLKPVGVDDPKDIKVAKTESGKSKTEQIVHGARQQVRVKREREQVGTEPDDRNDTSKPKKKKKKNPA